MTTAQANRLNCTGSETLSSSLDFTTYGNPTSANPLQMVGYTSVEDDGGVFELNGGTNAIINDATIDGVHTQLFKITNWGTSFCYVINDDCSFFKCEWDGESARTRVLDIDTDCYVFDCKMYDINAATSAAVNSVSTRTHFVNNYIHVVSTLGGWRALGVTNGGIILNNVISLDTTGTGEGIRMNAIAGTVIGNTVFNQSAGTGRGINNNSTGNDNNNCIGNIVCGFSGVGGVGIRCDSSAFFTMYGYNHFWNNTTDEQTVTALQDHGNNSALSANPFLSTGNADHNDDDFTVDASVKNLGYPAGLYDPGGAFGDRNRSFMEPGALQRRPGGGGGVSAVLARQGIGLWG